MLNERLKKARRENCLSQREAAKVLNVGQSTIARIETGSLLPSLPLLNKMCEQYGIGDMMARVLRDRLRAMRRERLIRSQEERIEKLKNQ